MLSQDDIRVALTVYRNYPIKLSGAEKQQAQVALQKKITLAEAFDVFDFISKPLIINNNNVSRGMAILTEVLKKHTDLSEKEWQKMWDKASKVVSKEEKRQAEQLKEEILKK